MALEQAVTGTGVGPAKKQRLGKGAIVDFKKGKNGEVPGSLKSQPRTEARWKGSRLMKEMCKSELSPQWSGRTKV